MPIVCILIHPFFFTVFVIFALLFTTFLLEKIGFIPTFSLKATRKTGISNQASKFDRWLQVVFYAQMHDVTLNVVTSYHDCVRPEEISVFLLKFPLSNFAF